MTDYFPCPRYCPTQRNGGDSFSGERLCDFCWNEYCFCWAEYCLDGWLEAQANRTHSSSNSKTNNKTQARLS
ncbi:hypothetical protein ACQFX9_05850 [Aliinostoc sp. HNIBRCY26]|uniref:hypothetical protein n=1 Tax=Aliinostoc sp. HNIBRCY26 TaxID=3418997 RepID=UPI003D07E81E